MATTVATLKTVLTMDAKAHEKGIKRAQGRLDGFARGATNVGQKLSLGLTAPLAGLGVMAVNIARDFEQSMDVLQATSQASGDQMGKLSELARKLGADVTLPGTSAADAAKAMNELARGGLAVNDILGASKGVLQLSAAANIENAEAAAFTVKALSAFRLQGEEAIRVADLLAASQTKSASSARETGLAMQQAAAVFASSNQPIEDLVTSISLMANAGIVGSDAGTSLKTAMLRLRAPVKEAAKEMARVGLTVRDSQGAMLPMVDIIGNLQKSMGELTDAQRDQALSTIFGQDAIRAATVLLEAGAEGFDTLKTKVTQQGTAAELAASRNKGLTGAMDALKSAFETLANDAMAPLLKDLAKLVRAVTPVLERFTKLSPETRRLAVIIAAVVAAIGPALLIFGQLAGAISTITAVAPGAIVALKGVALAMTGPVGLAVAAGIALIAGLVFAWRNNFLDLKGFVRTTWALIRTIFSTAIENIRLTLRAFILFLRGDFKGAFESVKQLFKTNLKAAVKIFGELIPRLQQIGNDAIEGLINGIKSGASRLKNAAVQVAKDAWTATKKWLQIQSPSQRFRELGRGILGGMIEGIQDRSQDLIAELEQVAQDALETLSARELPEVPQMFEDALAPVQEFGTTFRASVTNQFKEGADEADRLAEKLQFVTDAIAKFEGALERAEGQAPELQEGFGALVSQAFDVGIEKADEARKKFEELNAPLDAIFEKLTQAETQQEGGFLTSVNQAFDQLAAKARPVEEVMARFGVATERIFQRAFDNLDGGFGGFFDSVIGGFRQMLQQMAADFLASELTKLLLNALGGSSGGFGSFLASLQGRQFGGSVSAGQPVFVNEALNGNRGEVFVPDRSGTILPAGAGAGAINITFNISTPDVAGFQRSRSAIQSDVALAVARARERDGL